MGFRTDASSISAILGVIPSAPTSLLPTSHPPSSFLFPFPPLSIRATFFCRHPLLFCSSLPRRISLSFHQLRLVFLGLNSSSLSLLSHSLIHGPLLLPLLSHLLSSPWLNQFWETLVEENVEVNWIWTHCVHSKIWHLIAHTHALHTNTRSCKGDNVCFHHRR